MTCSTRWRFEWYQFGRKGRSFDVFHDGLKVWVSRKDTSHPWGRLFFPPHPTLAHRESIVRSGNNPLTLIRIFCSIPQAQAQAYAKGGFYSIPVDRVFPKKKVFLRFFLYFDVVVKTLMLRRWTVTCSTRWRFEWYQFGRKGRSFDVFHDGLKVWVSRKDTSHPWGRLFFPPHPTLAHRESIVRSGNNPLTLSYHVIIRTSIISFILTSNI